MKRQEREFRANSQSTSGTERLASSEHCRLARLQNSACCSCRSSSPQRRDCSRCGRERAVRRAAQRRRRRRRQWWWWCCAHSCSTARPRAWRLRSRAAPSSHWRRALGRHECRSDRTAGATCTNNECSNDGREVSACDADGDAGLG